MWHPDIPEEYRNQIVVGDARELVRRLPDESVDIVFTSPPWNKGIEYGSWNDQMPEDAFWDFQEDWTKDAYRVSALGTRLYSVISEDMIWRFREIAEKAGWRFHQILLWCKPNMVHTRRISSDWNMMVEYCLLFHKVKKTPMLNKVEGVNTHNWIEAVSAQTNYSGNNKKIFPAQMNFDVAFTWLARTPGKVLFEPFAGSGTTIVAAKMLGLDYIAFEIDPETTNLARKRVSETNPPLFTNLSQQKEMFDT